MHRFIRSPFLLLLLTAAACTNPEDNRQVDADPVDGTVTTTDPVRFTGRESCSGCHPRETERFLNSRHDLAMQHADEATVLGDFDDVTFTYNGVTSRFFKRDSAFYVRTDGPDGRLLDYAVSYTLGVFPLQQYLVEFTDGRIQALSIAWDSRPAADGGQRWFHLYPDDAVDHTDVLHWTGINQNWNTMCGECHTTGFSKNYDLQTRTYNTRWSEIDVSCEACHGPASRHIELAQTLPADDLEHIPQKGFMTGYGGSLRTDWTFTKGEAVATAAGPADNDAVLNICAPCHSHRITLDYDSPPGHPLSDSHRVSLLEPELYYPDGQIQAEVYVHGSFIQSRMHHAGVSCIDCHDQHSLRLKAAGSQVCARCHRPDVFASPEHHFHTPGTPGADCLDCHMPSRTYMQIDVRRDHSFRIPRPDLSMQIGVPNACNQCHTDQTAAWARDSIRKHTGRQNNEFHFGEALFAARNGLPDAAGLLQRVLRDQSAPGIARATALTYLSGFPGGNTLDLINAGLNAGTPLIRQAALQALERLNPAVRYQLSAPLLQDPVRMVRIRAARIMAALDPDSLPPDQRNILNNAIQEYIGTQREHADRAWAHVNLGNLQTARGQFDAAETGYITAIDLEPEFIPAYINLADLYRRRQQENKAAAVLRRALRKAPDAATVHQALGYSLVRQQQYNAALEQFATAAELAPDNTSVLQVYAIALNSLGQSGRAIEVLESAYKLRPGDREIIANLATLYRDAGETAKARHYAGLLAEVAPGDPRGPRLLESM